MPNRPNYLVPPAKPDPPIQIGELFAQWGIPPTDLQAKAIRAELEPLWKVLGEADRWLLIKTVTRIAAAESVKDSYNPKANPKLLGNLRKCAHNAARLSVQIKEILPQPWDEEQKCIRDLLTSLSGFIVANFEAALWPNDRALPIEAGVLLEFLRKDLGRGTNKVVWTMIRDLVWLRSKKKYRPSERTLGRYVRVKRFSKGPVWPSAPRCGAGWSRQACAAEWPLPCNDWSV